MEHNSTESNKKTIGNYTWIIRKQSGIVIKFDNNMVTISEIEDEPLRTDNYAK